MNGKIAHLLSVLVLLLVGCDPAVDAATSRPGGPLASDPDTVTVFAAASLTDAFTEMGAQLESGNPGLQIVFNFAGSQQLAQQLNQGAPGDVFASANEKQMEVAVESGRIAAGETIVFARNRLVVIFPPDNPAHISKLPDLTQPRLSLILAAPAVPVGRYTLTFLDRASQENDLGHTFKDRVLENVVSYEQNVRSVLTKVTLGEADAGIVYASDVIGIDTGDKVGTLPISSELNVTGSYLIAPISDRQNSKPANTFVEFVLSPQGQEILAEFGFIPVR